MNQPNSILFTGPVSGVHRIVSGELGQETENLDHRFTPKVVSHLKQIQEEISAGATTYTESEIDEHFKERARAWRESRAN